MSKLKISDLSFCETELSPNSQVQGGGHEPYFSDLRAYIQERIGVVRETVLNTAEFNTSDFGVASQSITEGEPFVEITQVTTEGGPQIISVALESSSP